MTFAKAWLDNGRERRPTEGLQVGAAGGGAVGGCVTGDNNMGG